MTRLATRLSASQCSAFHLGPKLGCALAPALLLIASTPALAEAEQKTEETRVIGGTKVETCGFPNVVSLDRGGMGCSGTLVHPKLVMTAAHCFMMGGTAKKVHFGERRGSQSRTAKVEKCVPHPSWKKTKEVGGTDIAYCVLAEEVTDVPITPILMGCETDVLKKGTPVVIAGYGLTRPPWNDENGSSEELASYADGVKHWAETRYIETLETGELKAAIVGSKGKQGCKGDSGGPVFVKLPKEKYGEQAGWRVFGVTSGQRSDTDPECTTGTGTYAIMHEWIETIEKETGLDLTPCFDADGTWNPGPDCHSAPRELSSTAGGSWPGSCEAGPLTGKITSCGKQDGGDDPKGKKSKQGESKKEDPKQSSKEESPKGNSSGKGKPTPDESKPDSNNGSQQGSPDSASKGSGQATPKQAGTDEKGEPNDSGCALSNNEYGGILALSLLGLGLVRRRKSSPRAKRIL